MQGQMEMFSYFFVYTGVCRVDGGIHVSVIVCLKTIWSNHVNRASTYHPG